MEKQEQYLLDYIYYEDGHVEILYKIDDSDNIYMRDAEPNDQEWLERVMRLDGMPDEMSGKLW